MSDIRILGRGQRELHPKHQFLVRIDNGWSAAFQKCSELSTEIAKIEYYEGGSAIPWKTPGRASFSDITLERGASSSKKFYEWCLEVMNASVGSYPTRGQGLITPYFMKDLKIIQLDRDGIEANSPRTWRVRNAWPTKFVAGDWDNTADEVVIEQLTLVIDFFELV